MRIIPRPRSLDNIDFYRRAADKIASVLQVFAHLRLDRMEEELKEDQWWNAANASIRKARVDAQNGRSALVLIDPDAVPVRLVLSRAQIRLLPLLMDDVQCARISELLAADCANPTIRRPNKAPS